MRHTIIAFLLLSLGACAVNPVTGKNQLSFTSPQQEIAIGQKHYIPTQQSQGGQYYLDPELTLYVNQVGKRLGALSGNTNLPYEFVVLNDSTPNAWALPGGKIAINRGLMLELDNEAELAAVLGHEVTHSAARHSAQKMDQATLLGVGMTVLGAATANEQYGNLVVGGAALGAQLVQSKYGRDDELEADYYGMQYMSEAGYNPQGAVKLQETFVRLSKGRQSDWISGLFASHPPSQSRVDANIKTAASLPAGGTNNRAAYQSKIGKLIKDKPAYDAYDKAKQAFTKKDYQSALSLVNSAIAKQNQESIFHELKGMALEAKGSKKSALSAYNKAISLNSHYFSHYLRRGLLKQALGDTSGANADLKASNKLLPTAAANYNLGTNALAAGNQQVAVQYLQTSARAGGEWGQASRNHISRIELPTRPGKYLPVASKVTSDNKLEVTVGNRSPHTVKNIVIEVSRRDGYRWQVVDTLRISGPLAPNQGRRVVSSRVNNITPSQLSGLQVLVKRAAL